MSRACDDGKVWADSGEKDAAGGHVVLRKITPGLNGAVSVTNPDGRKVHFVVLSPAETRQFVAHPCCGVANGSAASLARHCFGPNYCFSHGPD